MLYKITGLVLAGGKSTRMGTDKALLKLNNLTLMQHSLGKLKRLFKEIMVSINTQGKYSHDNIKEVSDVYPNCGPLGGIHAGLKEAEYEWMFVTACDMPFWEAPLVDELVKQRNGYNAVVPVLNNKTEPLFALYNKTCLPLIENNLKKNKYKVTDMFPNLNVNYFDTEHLLNNGIITNSTFMNINTLPEYNAILEEFISKENT